MNINNPNSRKSNVYVVKMSTEIESFFGNFCCTCMIRDNEADTEFQSIFDAIPNTDKRISDLLDSFSEYNIVQDMPNKICEKCVKRIADVHKFQEMLLHSQTKYRLLSEEEKKTEGKIASSPSALAASDEDSDPLKECLVDNINNEEEDESAEHTNQTKYSFSRNDDSMVIEKPFECHICQHTFEKARGLREHINRHHTEKKEKKHECEICHRKFHKDKGLKEHKYREHPPECALVCNICGKRYRSVVHYKKHKQTHKGEGNGEEVEPDEYLEQFLKKKKESRKPKRIYTCEFCQKTYLQTDHLKVHRRIHTGERPFLCKECGKSFRSKTTLDIHELLHAGVRKYECPFCPRKFIDMSNLITHKFVHSDLKPHVCDVCGAAFKFPYTLKKHKLYHGEKSVKCEQCDMRFYMIEHMRRHMLIHTGEKPYKCKYCERAYNQSNELMKHMKVHLGNNVYRCELCPRGFPLLKEMRKHFALHKNDDEATRKKNLDALAEYERNSSQQIKREKDIQV